MKNLFIFILISAFIFAQEEKKESPIVQAAKKTGKYKFQKGIKITNDKLKSSSSSETEVKETKEEESGEKILSEEYKDSKGRTKEDWKKMIKEAKENLAKWESRVKELQSELNKLTNDYYSWDDVAYREGVIKTNIDRVTRDLEKAKEELEKSKELIPELEEEARKSGALPGWLR